MEDRQIKIPLILSFNTQHSVNIQPGGRGWRGKITDIWWHVWHRHTGAGSGRETPETSHTVTPYTMLSCPLVRSHYKHHHNGPTPVLSCQWRWLKPSQAHTTPWDGFNYHQYPHWLMGEGKILPPAMAMGSLSLVKCIDI